MFYQSDSSTGLYIVLEGAVRASLLNQEGHELVLAVFDKGDFFDETLRGEFSLDNAILIFLHFNRATIQPLFAIKKRRY